MKVLIEIELGSDAMQTGIDVARALGHLAARMDEFGEMKLNSDMLLGVRDTNGNTVGKFEVRP